MKALILAAGKSERLSSLGLGLPKPLLEVNGKPLLQHHIENCARAGITEILINLHHLPEKITQYFGDGKKFGVKIHYHIESVIQGTGGAIHAFKSLLKNEPFLIIYGDNRWNYAISEMLQEHQQSKCAMSITVFEKEDVSQSGVVDIDPSSGKITHFFEKSAVPQTTSKWVNAGIYFMEPALLSKIPEGFSDFGKDLIPTFLKEGVSIHAIRQSLPVVAVDTPDLYRAAVTKNPLIILDRDGTINEMVMNPDHGILDSPMNPSQVEVLPKTLDALISLKNSGALFCIATNQPAAAKGKTTVENLNAAHQKILSILESHGIKILNSQICFHRSEDQCICRKPKVELLKRAIAESGSNLKEVWMVGDGITDIQAGASLGLKTAFIGSKKNELFMEFERLNINPTFWGSSLTEFAAWFKNRTC